MHVQPSKSEKEHILLVNPDEKDRKELALLLEENYTVSETADGQQALARITESPTSFFAVMIDFSLPDDGAFKLLQRMKSAEKTENIPVVIVISSRDEQNETRMLKNGADELVLKPYYKEPSLHRIRNIALSKATLKTSRKNVHLQSQRDMLSQMIVGGLLGAYIKKGFPLYYISDIMLSYLGFSSKEEFVAATDGFVANQMHPDDREMVWKNVNEQIAARGEYVVEYRYRKKDGTYLWVHDVGKRVTAENGEFATTSICYDITEQKILRQKLEDTRKIMTAIVDNIPSGVVKFKEVENKLRPVYMSDSFCTMLEDTRENLFAVYGENSMAGLHPDDYEQVSAIPYDPSKKSFSLTYRICNSRGEYRWVNNKISAPITEDGDAYYYAVYTDVTEEIKMKQETDRLYNTIPGAVFKCRFNADWDVIFANDGLFRFLGYTREEFKTRFDNKMSGVIYPEDGAIMVEKIAAQLSKGTTVHNENRLICKDGTIKWISIRAELLVDENDEQYFYCTFVDISEQKKAELELTRAQEKLIAAIAHAELIYWEYDIQNSRAYLSYDSTAADRSLPEVLENYPQSVYDLGIVDPESVETYQRLIDGVKKGEQTVTSDIRIADANGDFVWMRVRFTTLFDENKKPFWAVATAQTIDEYKSLEQQFTIAAEQTGIESWIYDLESRTITRTATTGSNYGIRPEMANIPESLIQAGIIYKDDIDTFYEMFEKIHNGEKTVSARVRILLAGSSEYHYYQINYTVLFDKNGKPFKAIGTDVDITQQVRLEQQYQETLKLYFSPTKENVLLSGYCNIDRNRILNMNAGNNVDYIEKFGDDWDIFFTILSDATCKDEKKQEIRNTFLSEPLKQAFTKGISKHDIRCKLLLPDSVFRYVDMSVKVLKNPTSEELTGFFSMMDVTEEVIYQKGVETSFEKYCDLIMEVDLKRDHYTVMAMPNSLDIPAKGIFSNTKEVFTQTLVDDSSREEFLRKLAFPYMTEQLRNADSYSFSFRKYENGKLCSKKVQIFYIDEELGRIAIIQTDITAMLAEEEEKRETLSMALAAAEQANKAKSDFLSRMSHDIRTPMNAIIGMTELSKKDMDNKAQLKENLDVIDSSSKLLLSIINDVLDMARIENGRMTFAQEPFDGIEEAQKVVKMASVMFKEKHQNFQVTHQLTNRHFIGDVVRLKRILMNLLNNSSKYTPDGGNVAMNISEEPHSNAQLTTLVFSVKDDGAGIPSDKLNTIFLPFEQLDADKHQGAGLGLSIVKSIVESQGGTITVESELGKGSTFTVRLPIRLEDKHNTAPSTEQVSDVAATADFTGMHILLVEDHPVNTMVAKCLLEQYGAVVDTAENGSIGYDKLIQSKEGTYDVIFMDIQMPVMNGYEAAKAIRESSHPQSRTIPIIAMTANAFTEDVQKSLDNGMNAHIAKPINIEVIAQTLYSVMGDTDPIT